MVVIHAILQLAPCEKLIARESGNYFVRAGDKGIASIQTILLKNSPLSNIVKNRIPVTKKDALKCP